MAAAGTKPDVTPPPPKRKQIGAFVDPGVFLAISREAIRSDRSRGDVLVEFAMKGGLGKLAEAEAQR